MQAAAFIDVINQLFSKELTDDRLSNMKYELITKQCQRQSIRRDMG